MNQLLKRSFAIVMVAVMLLCALPTVTITSSAASYTYNWGTREDVADETDFARSTAEEWYAAHDASYDELSQYSGASTSSSVPSSALYQELRSLMRGAVTDTTSYEDIKTLCQYTDCQNGGGKISSFYSGEEIGPQWNSSEWNREHTWPNSKGDANGSGENDIFMLRPTTISENSSRGNEAYGESGGFYNPNSESNGKYDLRGDVARIILFVYVRWQDTSNSAAVLFGSSGVMESKEVLLKWMEEDPVDTWELGRNDSCQSITGTRNVFVDYPELAFALYNEDVPADYISPSGGASTAYSITATSNNTSYGTVSVSGKTITATPKTGYYASGYTVTSGSATVTQNGNVFTVVASSDCSIQINFAAKTTVSVSFSGANVAAQSGYAGDAMTLPTNVEAPDGFTFVGWTASALSDDTTEKPSYYTDSFIPTTSTTLYALYSYVDETASGGSGDYVKVIEEPSDWAGEYLIVYESAGYILDGSLSTFDKSGNYIEVSISNNTISAEVGDPYKFTVTAYSSGYSFQGTSGMYFGASAAKNSLNTSATALENTLSLNTDGSVSIKGTGGYVLRFNTGDKRFRYYNGTQAAIALYVKDGSAGTTYYTTNPVKCEHGDTTNVAAAAATCTESGFTAGVYCNDCETYISGHEAVAALGHSYNTGVVTTDPTCTAAGVKTFTCSRCSDSYTEAVAATGHSYSTVVTPPTTYEQGYTTYTCSECGDSYVSDYVEALGETYTVSFSVPAGVEKPAQMECGKNGITLPTAGVPTGEYEYTFVGWATEEVDNTTEEPNIYTDSYTAPSNITLYAVYTYFVDGEGGSGSGDYEKVTTAPDDWSGEYVIVYEAGSVIFDSSLSKLDANNNNQSVTITDNVISAADADPYKVVIASVDGGYSIYTVSGYYVGVTSDSNNLDSSTSTVYSNTISLNDDGTVNIIGSGGAYLRYNTTASRFRFYKSSTYTNQKAIALYVKSGSSATKYYTTLSAVECGHINTNVDTVDATCTEAGSETVTCADCGEIISTNVIAALGHTEVVDAGYAATYTETGLTEGKHCSVCGEVTVVQEVIPVLANPIIEWNVCLSDNIGVNFVTTLTDADEVGVTVNNEPVAIELVDGKFSIELAAAQMTDAIQISVNGETLEKTYSVRGYADEILAGNYDAATKNLVKYMLNYGGAAQNYFEYNTGNMANKDITVDAVEVPAAAETELSVSGSAEGIVFYGASLVHRDKIAIRFYFTGSAAGVEGAVVKDDMFYVEVAGILPQDYDQAVTVVVGGLTVSYSPMNYIVRMNNKADATDATKALVQALYGYYLAAEAYTIA